MHRLIKFFYRRESQRFQTALDHLEEVQRLRLQQILKINCQSPFGLKNRLSQVKSYEEFAEMVPPSDYSQWQQVIEGDRKRKMNELNRSVIRYEPTSGTSGSRKWIPYTSTFLSDTNRAAQAWIFDMYQTFPNVANGKHYWSISWIPNDLRKELDTNDINLFPKWQIPLLKTFMAMSPAIQQAPSSEAAWWATKLLIASCKDLSLISVWSPSYALNLAEEIFQDRKEISVALKNRSWGPFEKELSEFRPFFRSDFPNHLTELKSFTQEVWPQLKLLSCWDSGPSARLADDLKSIFPHVTLQGKGLWATEGVVTIPWQGKFPLAIRSHFYEFKCLATDHILPSWKLKKGQEVQPLLTTSNGLCRIFLSDRLVVSDFIDQTPCFHFLGRLDGIDLVGEKVSFAFAENIIRVLNSENSLASVYCLAAGLEGHQGRYCVVGIGDDSIASPLALTAERKLMELHHYKLARELNQLLPVKALLFKDHSKQSEFLERSSIKGQNKMNSIVRLC